MVAISIDASQMDEIAAALKEVKNGVEIALQRSLNDSARHANTQLVKKIRENVAFKKASDVKKHTKVSLANRKHLSSRVSLKETARISLKYFGAKQTRKGVSYRISKKGNRGFVAGAFQGPKPGTMKASWKGHAFKRVGKNRLPIVKLHGPSPWGVTVKSGLDKSQSAESQAYLYKRLNHHVGFLLRPIAKPSVKAVPT